MVRPPCKWLPSVICFGDTCPLTLMGRAAVTVSDTRITVVVVSETIIGTSMLYKQR